MKISTLLAFCVCSGSLASAQITVTAQRLSSLSVSYSLTNSGWNVPNQAPAYFSIPVNEGLSPTLSCPQGFETYGTINPENSWIDSFAYAAKSSSSILQMPQYGQTISGFTFAAQEPFVLETNSVLFGIGDFTTNEIVNEGEVLAPVPVKGSVQVSGVLELGGYQGLYGNYKAGLMRFVPIVGTEFDTLVRVGSDGQLLCAGPDQPGTYTVYCLMDGCLVRQVQATVSNGECVINTSLTSGDCDNDNEIGLSDFGILSGSFGTFEGDPGFDRRADIDGDNEVGLADFGLLSGSFGSFGD